MPETKKGVDDSKLSDSIKGQYGAIDKVFQEYAKRDAVITSGSDGTHMEGSKHYEGNAIDLRTRDMTKESIEKSAKDLRSKLGKDYDVVVEKDHIHVEYDPKTQTQSQTAVFPSTTTTSVQVPKIDLKPVHDTSSDGQTIPGSSIGRWPIEKR